MVSSSSSSSSKLKMRRARIQQTLFQRSLRSLINREGTVFKKAYELSVLCKTQVCVICYGPDKEYKTWPENVRDIAREYIGLSLERRRKGSVTLSQFLKKIDKGDSNNNKKKVKYPVWDPWFNSYSKGQLMELVHSLERKRTGFQHRIGVVEGRGQRRTHNTYMADEELMMTSSMNHLQQHSNQNMDMADEELMMTSSMNHLQQHSNQNTNMANQNLMMNSTMNHLQQQSNQFSRFLYENGIFSPPIPFSALYLNQAQSLASNVGNYSRSLGAQESGIINGFQNMNMCTYNNTNGVDNFPNQIDQSKLLESYSGLLEEYGFNEFDQSTNMHSCNLNTGYYSGLLRGQETETDALQNLNMQDFNINANYGLLHQFGQFPTPTAAAGFQY